MTREQAITEARHAAARAMDLAGAADRYLDHPDLKHEIPRLTAVGALYADVSRAHTALAAALPDTTEETNRG